MRRVGRVCARVAVAGLILLAACSLAAVLLFRSGWFQERVRERIITEMETTTGGRVEIGTFSFNPARLEATVAPLVLHGLEPPTDEPLLRVESVTIGLRIISMMERKVDLASVKVRGLIVRFAVYPDGSDNLPVPRHPNGRSWAEDMLSVSIRQYQIDDGLVEYDNRRVPIHIRGEDLQAHATFDPTGPSYRGELKSRRMRVTPEGVGPIELDGEASFAIERTRLVFSSVRLATAESRVDLSGTLEDVRRPHGTFTVKGSISTREVVKRFDLPIAPSGTATFEGRLGVSLTKDFDYGFAGSGAVRGIGYSSGRLKVEGAAGRADLNLVPGKLTLRSVKATALGATLTGQGDYGRDQQFHFEGHVEGLDVRRAASIASDRPIAWNGTAAGDFMVDAVAGQPTAKVRAHAEIVPAADGTPIQGELDVFYDQQTQEVQLGNSRLATAATRVELSGTLGKTLQVNAQSSNLDDVLPALELLSADAPKELPLKLVNGQASLNGTVTGNAANPHFTGKVAVTSARVIDHALGDHPFDRFAGDVDASQQSVSVRNFALARGPTEIAGQAQITPRDGKFDSASINDAGVAAQLTVRNAQITELAKEAGVTSPISGVAGATVRLTGTVQRPTAEIALQVENPEGFGEKFDRLRTNISYTPSTVEAKAGEADIGPGKIQFEGTYQHREGDLKNGEVRFTVGAQKLSIARMAALTKLQGGLDGTLEGKINGTARVAAAEVTPASANGDVTVRGMTLDREMLGDLSLTAAMEGTDLKVSANAQVRDVKIQGQGDWKLEGNEPGSGTLRFSRVDIATLHDLVMIGVPEQQRAPAPTFEGFIEGAATFSVPLRKVEDFQGRVTLSTLQFNPKTNQTPRLGVTAQDLLLRNTEPVVIEVSSKAARIQSAKLTARETVLEVAGGVPFDSKAGADLTVRGTINLPILQLVNMDLAAMGSATVQATIRGSLQDPLVNGRLDVKNASLYLNDVPNGLDNVNGSLLFDRNRATIERLTADTGGGAISFGGFFEFSGRQPAYRVQVEAQQIRIRYPEDVSTTFTGRLSLNGTSDSSTVSGSLTLDRATFNPRTDLGQLIAQSTKPVPAPAAPSPYLRGMQFDVRVDSSPNFELQTSLTRDVEASVDLRLRGTPLNPVLLGLVSINQGAVQIFGNTYTVDRGDIRFVNGVKIEPVFDMDLETRARGITVNVSLSGTLQKLNVNYSSDPPLQSREIIELLAVGRSPTEAATLQSQGFSTSSGANQAGTGLLGQAVSEQLTSRLQRFFGASRVKIDPTLTGVENIPQARLTFEQQVSKDITLTYITNLNRTSEQIVQLQWDLSKAWSAVAVRDSNGLFGVDFLYRKRFR